MTAQTKNDFESEATKISDSFAKIIDLFKSIILLCVAAVLFIIGILLSYQETITTGFPRSGPLLIGSGIVILCCEISDWRK